MKILKTINPQQATKTEVDQYRVREAARAVVIDATGQVGLLKVTKRKFYKLPGGGIEGKSYIVPRDRVFINHAKIKAY